MLRFPRLTLLCYQGAIVLLLLEPACRRKQVAVPVPPPPAPISQPHSSDQPTTPAPDSSAKPAGPAAPSSNPQQSPYQVNKPAQPPPAAPRKASRSTAPPSTPPGAPAPSPAPPAQAPVLGDIVTPDQQRQLNAAIDQSLSRAQASLASIANKELSKDQQALVEQIRNIIQQAQGVRSSDLPGAKSLAERAEVLAKDLAGSFR